MPIRKQEFYEGAALHLLARSEQIVGVLVESPFFLLNGRLLVLLKYSTKGRSPWGFSFALNEQTRLQEGAAKYQTKIGVICGADGWPAPGSEDTELGVLMELEVGHGETEVYAGVQA